MTPVETSLGGQQREFTSTLWTIVLTARDASSVEARRALNTLISLYWKPIYTYVRRHGRDVESAKDLTQEFLAGLLEGSFIERLDPTKGRFRSYLLGALSHFLSDEFDRRNAAKRGGGRTILPIDLTEIEANISVEESPDRAFHREWVGIVIGRAMEALEREYSLAGKATVVNLLKEYISSPGKKGTPVYEMLAARHGITSKDVANRLHRARLRLRTLLEAQVREYTSNHEELEEELASLLSSIT